MDHPLLAGRVTGGRKLRPQPIRITPQYVNIPAELLNTLQSEDGPIQSAIRYFQSFLSVNRFSENLKAPPSCQRDVPLNNCPIDNLIPPMCGPHVQVPVDHTAALVICNADMTTCAPPRGNDSTGVANSDYVLYITSQQDGNKELCKFH